MKAKKKTIFILFLLSSFLGYSQNNPTATNATDWNSTRSNKTSKTTRTGNPNENKKKNNSFSKNMNIGIDYGVSLPSSSLKDQVYAGNGSVINISGAYYFSKFGLGLSIGQISNPTSGIVDLTENFGFAVKNQIEDVKSNYIGIGAEYRIRIHKFETTLQVRTGLYSIEAFSIESDNTEKTDVVIPFYTIKSKKNTNIAFVSTGVKFGYHITKSLSLFANADYMSALSDKLVIKESKIEDLNRNGIIDKDDFKGEDGVFNYSTTEKNIKPSTINIRFGISFHFGHSSSEQQGPIKRKRPGRTKYSNITLRGDDTSENNNIQIEKNKVKEVIKKKEAVKNKINPQNPQDDENSKSKIPKNTSNTTRVGNPNNEGTPNPIHATDWNSTRSNKTSKTTRVGNPNNEGTPNPIHATDWNSTRSNKTSKTTRVGNPNNEGTPNPIHATDWNSTRSNKTSKTTRVGNPNNEGIPNPIHATDWNSTRSNKTSKTTRVGNPNNEGTPNPIHATDWNSTRSNKTSKTTRVGNPNNEGIPNPIHATDWNSTRSNKTSKTTRVGNPNNEGTPNPIHATDWNSTRSNKTSKTTRVGNPNNEGTPNPIHATDWNSTRSNKTSKTTRVGNPNNEGTPNPIHATDWNSTRSNKTSKTTRVGNPNGNNQDQIAKKECLKAGGIFWQNADGSYSCQTAIKKSQETIKIPSKLASELASAKKAALADKTQKGAIEITVVYPDKNKTLKVSIPSSRIQDAETILQDVKGNHDKNGKVRIKYVAKL